MSDCLGAYFKKTTLEKNDIFLHAILPYCSLSSHPLFQCFRWETATWSKISLLPANSISFPRPLAEFKSLSYSLTSIMMFFPLRSFSHHKKMGE